MSVGLYCCVVLILCIEQRGQGGVTASRWSRLSSRLIEDVVAPVLITGVKVLRIALTACQ